jgi:dTDP-4-amino-4,6-dideoxygalactose transaminase
MTTGSIPFLDLSVMHRGIEGELTRVFTDALRSGRFIGGPMVENFERYFAEYCGTKHAVGVNSGTDALRFALMGAGIKKDDVVVTVPNTFIATVEAISQAGASVRFVDVDERTYTLDTKRLEAFFREECRFDAASGRTVLKATSRPVTAIVPVHLYGQMADMDAIVDLAEKYHCKVIEDACQAHGAGYLSKRTGAWHRAGTLGAAAAYSFYPGKNLGALGEGGAVATDNDEIANAARMLRDHGQRRKYFHDMEGYNGRLDAIQAGILSIKLEHLDGWNDARRIRAADYNGLLGEIEGVVTPFEPEWSKAVYHLYVIRVPRRDELKQHLQVRGIETGLHYPVPLHLQKAYAAFGFREGDFPVSEKTADEILSLPMFPGLTGAQQEYVADSIAEFYGRTADEARARRQEAVTS